MEISVTLVTLNEEENLARCLDSIKKFANEIVIVDSGSIDKTVEIAKKFGARVFYRKFDNFSNQKNFAADKAKNNWVFSLDADEVMTGRLAGEVVNAVKTDKFVGYLIPRRNIILGKEIKHTRWSPDEHVWLYRKDRGRFEGGVHAEVKVDGSVGRLKHTKVHFQYKTVGEFFLMINKYTEEEAGEKIERGEIFSIFKMFFDPALSFFRRFIYKRGYLDGWRGFVLSYMMAIYRITNWIKVWERQRK
ncbi:hypothetical protein A2686_03200 [Candidatus Woesebacteria bacterium RIFCSPHIGHO2_01_FULL_38_10]|uniref:Glycosyltransferase 2-like domain-containing protein n=1 Tax=Candidatus Woesebacteria bacterium RIFCSPLOWO2_01_FULL_39_10b TaxID=1802517 RepID=A0A1F8B792_9BACT|nr:MAG: hypothetical protein A2686_03200 [Candidatus Woesebacteria bacterium RIFCSPHIGHO2_01_FULL_38_10]OGM59285.1 MAG: hypothetical protein A2892_05480 [Candidatus Woesebacteria bacterium RIFCSPLOWO2_01_FULL_39_10b]